jgi:hypothetical protein
MTNKETAASIKRIAKAYRKDHKEYMPQGEILVDVNHSIPYLAIQLPNDKEYHFQGEPAGDILEEATTASNKFNVSLEDAILWLASGWG